MTQFQPAALSTVGKVAFYRIRIDILDRGTWAYASFPPSGAIGVEMRFDFSGGHGDGVGAFAYPAARASLIECSIVRRHLDDDDSSTVENVKLRHWALQC